MKVDDYAFRVTEALAQQQALKSPEAAYARTMEHMRRWEADLWGRNEFYTEAVNRKMMSLPADEATRLQRIWEGMVQVMGARAAGNESAAAEVDAWLEPLIEEEARRGSETYLSTLMDCDGGYFTPEVNRELTELYRVPGYHDAASAAEAGDDA